MEDLASGSLMAKWLTLMVKLQQKFDCAGRIVSQSRTILNDSSNGVDCWANMVDWDLPSNVSNE